MTTRTDIGAQPILGSPWPDPAVPDISLPEFLLATAAEFASRPAITNAVSGRMLRYEELADGVRRVATGLAALGLRPADVFAILAPNSPEWLLGCYGAMAAGGVVTGINPLYTPAEVAAQLADADARFVLTTPAFAPTARAAVGQAGGRARIVMLGSASDDQIPFTALLGQAGQPGRERTDPEALALLPYSSGTTGLAKGVMLTRQPGRHRRHHRRGWMAAHG